MTSAKLIALPVILVLSACVGDAQDAVPGDSEDTQPFAEITEDQVLRLVGTEPFWGAEIVDGTMMYNTPENIEGRRFAVTRFAGRGGLSFSGKIDGAQVDALITPGECSDGMSDRVYPYTATIEIGGEQRLGCAYREGVDE